MTKNILSKIKISILSISALILLLGVVLVGSPPASAAPHTVTYKGTRVTTAVSGKPFNLSFQVKNTSSDNYSNVQITFHVPSGMQHSSVSPANATIEDNTITWVNVPMNAGQTFNPTFTFTLDSGIAINTKLNLWVEVTGSGLEATSTNFSITARKTAAATTSALTSTDIKTIFQSVYGRTPTASELNYWLGRRTDKPQRSVLLGAISYHRVHNIKH